MEEQEMIFFKAHAFFFCPEGKKARRTLDRSVLREKLPVLVVERRRGNMAFAAQRTQGFLSIDLILEAQGGAASVTYDLTQRGEIMRHPLAIGDQFVRDKSTCHHQQGDRACRHDDKGELPLDGNIPKPDHACLILVHSTEQPELHWNNPAQ